MKSENNGYQVVLSEKYYPDFDQQKQKHPVVHPYDIQVLSRMMVEISMADGHMIQSEEIAYAIA